MQRKKRTLFLFSSCMFWCVEYLLDSPGFTGALHCLSYYFVILLFSMYLRVLNAFTKTKSMTSGPVFFSLLVNVFPVHHSLFKCNSSTSCMYSYNKCIKLLACSVTLLFRSDHHFCLSSLKQTTTHNFVNWLDR